MQTTEKTYFNKSINTNIIAIIIIFVGLTNTSTYHEQILSIGLFAFSGAMTNWLAIHMLFEKIPFLYGSGVIPNHFETFKISIRALIMEQFFNKANLENFLLNLDLQPDEQTFDAEKLANVIDYDQLFQQLVEAIMASSFGNMINMMGGAAALDGLKEPITQRLRDSLIELTQKDSFQVALRKSLVSDKLTDNLSVKLEQIIDTRLDELTPQIVKQIVQDMIRQHLGWLVVWGGVFGGIIGFFTSYL